MDFRFFALTVSPPYRSKMSPKYLYSEDKYVLERWLNKFSRHWILYPEFSKDSRLHYHGVVRVDDKIKLHKTRHQMVKKIGFIKLDKLATPRDHLRWVIYCQKEYADTRRLAEVFHRRKLKKHTVVNTTASPNLLDWIPGIEYRVVKKKNKVEIKLEI